MVAPSECSSCTVDKVSARHQLNCHVIASGQNCFLRNAYQEYYWKEFSLETEVNISLAKGSLNLQVICVSASSLLYLLPSCDTTTFEVFLQPKCQIRLH